MPVAARLSDRAPRSLRTTLTVCSTLLPALLWYAWRLTCYDWEKARGRRPITGRSGWACSGPPRSWTAEDGQIRRLVFARASVYPGQGAGLALVGLALRHAGNGNRDGLWLVSGIAALVGMAMLGEEDDHEGSVWVPQTACEAAIVQMAVDRCIGASTTTSDIYNAGSVSRGAGIGLNAASSAFDGIISSVMGLITNPLLTSATLVATLGTSIARVFSGSTSSSLSIKNMYAAAGSYSLNNQKLAKDETYYKGLWNAVGSVCPPNPILGGFEMEKSDTGYSAPVTSP